MQEWLHKHFHKSSDVIKNFQNELKISFDFANDVYEIAKRIQVNRSLSYFLINCRIQFMHILHEVVRTPFNFLYVISNVIFERLEKLVSVNARMGL